MKIHIEFAHPRLVAWRKLVIAQKIVKQIIVNNKGRSSMGQLGVWSSIYGGQKSLQKI
jgi:hypothetical protein